LCFKLNEAMKRELSQLAAPRTIRPLRIETSRAPHQKIPAGRLFSGQNHVFQPPCDVRFEKETGLLFNGIGFFANPVGLFYRNIGFPGWNVGFVAGEVVFISICHEVADRDNGLPLPDKNAVKRQVGGRGRFRLSPTAGR
jgi:hypothetical protein